MIRLIFKLPVIKLSSHDDEPFITFPSTGIARPGITFNISPRSIKSTDMELSVEISLFSPN